MKKEFMLGCNYWASNAGTEMWRDWDAEAVEADLKFLSGYGVKYMRVFPNWRDFQPVYPLHEFRARVRDYRLHDHDIPKNPYYLDEVMLERFDTFCDIAEKYGIKLIVGIITGYMSGRTYIPPAMFERKLDTDPVALLFQQRFVHGMAEIFKDKKAIYAWDLGNECNNLYEFESRESALNWSMLISNAIKSADATRPIISGMHCIGTDGVWRITDQAETTDILTTHPYPFWVEHCSEAENTSVQTLMHATCETKYYSNIGGKPCLVEEINSSGPMVSDDANAANFLRVNLYSNWANGGMGLLWWCANEQIDLMHPPYDFTMLETELGMRYRDGSAKPVLEEMKRFSDWLKTVDYELPEAADDAVCLVTWNQKQWGAAYSSYVLAKQAGANIRFADASGEIPESDIYLLPSISGVEVMTAQNYFELRRRVENGATLYISNDNGILSDFKGITGVTVNNTRTKAESGAFELNGRSVKYSRERSYLITATGAQVLAADEDGMPIFTKYRYGKGTVYYLNFPLEKNLLGVCDGFDGEQHTVYEELMSEVKARYAVTSANKYIGITAHNCDDGQWIVMINYSGKPQKPCAAVKDGCKLSVLYGSIDEIPPFEMTVIKTEK